MSGASRFDMKNLLDASNTLPCAVEPVSAQNSSDSSGKFLSNIP